MFLGHFALSLGAKQVAPSVSLGALILAGQFADLLWPMLVLAGVERVAIHPGATVVTPLDFVSYPYSHSLLALVAWGFLVGLTYWLATRSAAAACITLALLVVSHWALDVISHRPDMPLTPGGATRVGFGLWNSLPATLLVEGLLFVAGIAIYLKATTARDRIGSVGVVVAADVSRRHLHCGRLRAAASEPAGRRHPDKCHVAAGPVGPLGRSPSNGRGLTDLPKPSRSSHADRTHPCAGRHDHVQLACARASDLGALGRRAAVRHAADLDVVGFALGVRYRRSAGHRGLSHSLVFAAIVATAFLFGLGPCPRRAAVWWFLFLCTASHGVLDAATDGGLGVAFFSPFSNKRYFWPWRPIRVAPIGLTRIFSERGMAVLQTELVWIWLPCAVLMLARHARLGRRTDEHPGARGR